MYVLFPEKLFEISVRSVIRMKKKLFIEKMLNDKNK